MIARVRLLIHGLFRRRRFETEMSEELRFHVDAFAEDLVRTGTPRHEALRRARIEFGGVEAVKDCCRQSRGLRIADECVQDLRYAIRTMTKAPVVTTAVIISLAFGIGANTALFGFVDAVFLRTVPVRSPHELFYLAHESGPRTQSNYPLFERYASVDSFSGVTAYLVSPMRVGRSDTVESVTGQFVSGNYHSVLGVAIALGRGFSSEPDRNGSRQPVAVISDNYWDRAFGRSPGVIGTMITVYGRSTEIVGVTGPRFYGFDSQSRVDITLPLSGVGLEAPEFFDDHNSWMPLNLIARLKPGVSEAQALAAADYVFQGYMREPEQRWVREGPNADRFRRAALLSAARGSNGRRELTEKPFRVLLTMAGILLLIACANVANLLLVRSTSRRREVAMRAAAGASRRRLIRQFTVEGLLLALCGGLVALPVATWTSGSILSLLDAGPTPFLLDVTLDVRVLAFTFVVATLTGIGFTLLPAIRATAHTNALAPALRTSDVRARDGRATTGASVLVASQIALCVVLVVAAGLLTRSLRNLDNVDAGFERGRMVLADVNTVGSEFSPTRRMRLYDSMLERLRQLPSVLSVAVSTRTPIDSSSRVNKIVVAGVNVQGFHGVSPNIVSPEYFRTFGIKLVHGRLFTHDDGADRPKVAVVSESMARFYFGDEEPLGRSFLLGTNDPITIVGVVANVRHERLSEREPPKMVYTPLAQVATVTANGQNPVPTQVTVGVRTAGDPRALAPLLQSEVRRLNRVAVMSYVRTLEQQLDAALVRERLLAALSAGFSALALLLACVGVYGTLSHTVARRSREIGIRMALGAARRTVVGRVLRQCLTIAGCGVVLGGIVAIWMSRTLSAFLFEISPRDPLTLAATAALLLVTAGAAGYLPARRAARIDPACVLKID